MSSIRISKIAEDTGLLRYAQSDRSDNNAFFPTYAHLVLFAAVIGYNNSLFCSDPEFAKKDPIAWDIFENQRLERGTLADIARLLGICHEEDVTIVGDTDSICKIVEGYSHEGFRLLNEINQSDDCGGNALGFMQYWETEMELINLPNS